MKSIDEMPVDHCVLELRFNPTYLLWDRVGSIWSAMIAANPSLKAAAIQANQQVFETESLQLTLEISVLRVRAREPNAVDEVVKNANSLIRIVCEKTKLDAFTRAGFRIIRIKAFETSAQALRFAQISNEKSSAISSDNQTVGYAKSFRHESENSGIQSAVRVEERDVSFNVPWDSRPFLPSKLAQKEFVVVFDSDYYTIGIVDRDGFDTDTWVRQALKAIQSHGSNI